MRWVKSDFSNSVSDMSLKLFSFIYLTIFMIVHIMSSRKMIVM